MEGSSGAPLSPARLPLSNLPLMPLQIKALFPDNTWARRCATASLVAVPFRPFVVSSVHAAVMEWEFVRQARAHKVSILHAGVHTPLEEQPAYLLLGIGRRRGGPRGDCELTPALRSRAGLHAELARLMCLLCRCCDVTWQSTPARLPWALPPSSWRTWVSRG